MRTPRPAERLLADLRLEANGVPIYVQIRDQVLQALAAGVLTPGDQMPTMRQVAVALKVDLNTVRHAYAALEQSGVITLARGRGSFVSAPPPPETRPEPAPAPDARVESLARQMLAQAQAQGLAPGALIRKLAELSGQEEDFP